MSASQSSSSSTGGKQTEKAEKSSVAKEMVVTSGLRLKKGNLFKVKHKYYFISGKNVCQKLHNKFNKCFAI
jgi:hypothetical protein